MGCPASHQHGKQGGRETRDGVSARIEPSKSVAATTTREPLELSTDQERPVLRVGRFANGVHGQPPLWVSLEPKKEDKHGKIHRPGSGGL